MIEASDSALEGFEQSPAAIKKIFAIIVKKMKPLKSARTSRLMSACCIYIHMLYLHIYISHKSIIDNDTGTVEDKLMSFIIRYHRTSNIRC